MGNVIKKLSSEILEQFGFNFDGYYWIRSGYPFRLFKCNESEYQVSLAVEDSINNLPKVTTNSELLGLLLSYIPYKFEMEMKDKKVLNQNAAFSMLSHMIRQELSFDSKFKFVIGVNNGVPSLIPNDEYTYTYVSGSESEFRIMYQDKSGIKSTETSCNAQCMSLDYAKSLTESDQVISVHIKDGDDWIEFFGCGIPKVKENDSNN